MSNFSSSKTLPLLIVLCMLTSLSGCGGNENDSIHRSNKVNAGPPITTAIINPNRSVSGPRKNYVIRDSGSNYVLTNLADANDTMALPIAAAAVNFEDMRVNLSMIDKARSLPHESLENLVELYIAFFNRIPDADGLEYWSDQLQRGNTLENIAENFYTAALEFAELTGYSSKMTDDDFVRIVYKNVLGRSGTNAPPQQDVDYWANQLRTHQLNHGTLVRAMLNSAHTFINDPEFSWVAHLLDNKKQVGIFFAATQGLNFQTDEESIIQGMKIAAAITPSSTADALTLIGVDNTALVLNDKVSDKTVQLMALLDTHCLMCHGPIRDERAPALYNHFLITYQADAIYTATNITHSMPREDLLSNAELLQIQVWHDEVKN